MKEYEWNSVNYLTQDFVEKKICKVDEGPYGRINASEMIMTSPFFGGVCRTYNTNTKHLVIDAISGRSY